MLPEPGSSPISWLNRSSPPLTFSTRMTSAPRSPRSCAPRSGDVTTEVQHSNPVQNTWHCANPPIFLGYWMFLPDLPRQAGNQSRFRTTQVPVVEYRYLRVLCRPDSVVVGVDHISSSPCSMARTERAVSKSGADLRPSASQFRYDASRLRSSASCIPSATNAGQLSFINLGKPAALSALAAVARWSTTSAFAYS